MSRNERIEHYAGIAVASVIALLFGVSYGWTYAVDNQLVYLLSALRMVHPGVLDNDWLATQTTHYHPTFTYVAYALMSISETAVGVALTFVCAAGMLGVYWLLRALEGVRRALPAFMLLSAVLFLTRTKGPCATYVFDHILQPSTISSAVFLISVPLFVRGRWLASGVALAISGLFHINLLLLFFGAYLIAQLMLGTDGLRGRLLRQLGPGFVVILLFSPMLLASATAKDGKLAQDIYATIRAPHHFVIKGHERDFLPYIGWTLLGLGAAAPLARGARSAYGRLAALLAGLLAVTWGGVALASAFELRTVRHLFPWRIVPHAILLTTALAAVAATRVIFEPSMWRRYGAVQLALMIAGVGALFITGGDKGPTALQYLIVAALAAVAVVLLGGWLVDRFAAAPTQARLRALGRRAALPVALAATLGALVPAARGQLAEFDRRSNVFTGIRAGERELYTWMREKTDPGALFLTPPDVENMRYHGQRAIVVDWKSNPGVPTEVLEWFRRLQDVVGKPIRSSKDLDGYNSLDEPRLRKLKERYKFDYVVVRRGKERGLPFTKVYSGPAFVVLDVRG